MVDKETLKECQVCLIGYLLKNIEEIDKLSITKDYLKRLFYTRQEVQF